MTASTALPPADQRVGVVPGWWVTTIPHAAQTAHRLATAFDGTNRGRTALCGRIITAAARLDDDAPNATCQDCTSRADRALSTEQTPSHVPPPPSRPRPVVPRSAPTSNTVADRVARRVAFRNIAPHNEVQDYTPHDYGLTVKALEAARLTPQVRR